MTNYSKTLNYESDCNCATNSPEDSPSHQGKKGTTIWKCNETIVTITPGNSYTISFTNTGPKCGYATDNCLLMYRVHTSQDSQNWSAVRITTNLNNSGSGEIYHSKWANHDIEEVVDLQQMTGYQQTDLNEYTFYNDSDVDVQLWNLRIFRGYAMNQLQQQSPNDTASDYGSDGNIDNTREDYPCNYFSYGNRYSFTYWEGYQDNGVNEISVNDTFTYTFQNPPAPLSGPANYLGPIACFFNFNNVQTSGTPSGYDIHYVVKLNNTVIQHFYIPTKSKTGDPCGAHQFPGVDLAESAYVGIYNPSPDETNVVQIYPVDSGDGNLKLVDGSVGYVNIYRFYEVANLCQDNFDDNNTELSIWETLSNNGGSVAETNGQLQVNVAYGNGWGQAGYVSKFGYDTQAFYGSNQQGFEATIDVTQLSSLDQLALLISDAKTTDGDPLNVLDNSYRIVKGRKNWNTNCLAVEIRTNGNWSSKLNIPWYSSTGQLKIKVSTGSIAFYENGILRYAEPFALPSNVPYYVYAYTSSERIHPGTDYFDNFTLNPTDIVRDEFADGNYDGWTVDSGSWGIQNGRLQSSTYNSHIHYYYGFSANRHVRADMQLVSPGENSWEVPILYVKEQDGNNNIYALIHTTGLVELAIVYQGQKTMYNGGSYVSSPYNSHSVAVSIIGTNAKVWIDGTLQIDATNNNFANIAGYVGLYTWNSTGKFDSIAVFSQ
jgi:hypothetical protein